jgi:hypothetical protein
MRTNIDDIINDTKLNLAYIYQKTAKNIKSELSDLYEKYGQSGQLTYSEMSKYNRLNNLLKSVNDITNSSFKEIGTEFKGLVSTVYDDAYYMNGFILSNNAGINLNFGIIPTEAIKALYNDVNVSGLSLLETNNNLRYKLLLKERQEMIQGFIKGDSYLDMAERISDVFGRSFSDALRIAETEGNRSASEGMLSLFDDAEEMGIEFDRIWVATLDDKTRDTHADLDGTPADEDGLFWIGGDSAPGPVQWGIPEEDINCRCSVIAQMKDTKPTIRRENVGDKEIIEYKTYREWKKDQE